jgi:hypothetical protein
MSVFIAITLPFQEIYFEASWQTFAAILLIAVIKMLEFQMSALVLVQLSAFELKAWLGVTLFASYITDTFYGADLRVVKVLCIAATVLGLIFISKSGRKGKRNYPKIIIPLVLYLVAKYSYGVVIKGFSPYVSSTLQLLPALILISIILLPKAAPIKIIRKNSKGALKVVLARIPNAIGMILENAVISISLVNYSFIQPMILVSLFIIGLTRRERCSRLNLIGSIICVIGVIAFRFL